MTYLSPELFNIKLDFDQPLLISFEKPDFIRIRFVDENLFIS